MATLNPCRTCGQPPVVDDGSDFNASIGCIPCDSWTKDYDMWEFEQAEAQWNSDNPVESPAPWIDYASMTPEERHAYCLSWMKALGIEKSAASIKVVHGIEVFQPPALMDKYTMLVDGRKSFRISESFGLDGIGDVYPVFAIIRAIERGELK